MAKFKVISVGDKYCVMRLSDDGVYTIVKGSYRETWKGAEAHMEALQFQDFRGLKCSDEGLFLALNADEWTGVILVVGALAALIAMFF